MLVHLAPVFQRDDGNQTNKIPTRKWGFFHRRESGSYQPQFVAGTPALVAVGFTEDCVQYDTDVAFIHPRE